MNLDELNQGRGEAVDARLAACNASTRWVQQILAGRPYPTRGALLAAADHATRLLAWPDIREALDAHPRIGDIADTGWSRHEQAAVHGSAGTTQELLRNGNIAYERRFGHVFLIRAAGRSAEEVLDQLHRRLGNDDASERAEVIEQLAQITRLRLQRLLAEGSE